MTIGRYVIPIKVLQRDPDVTVDVLRLAALANALNAIVGMSATAVSKGVGSDRDTLQTSLLVASYLKEAIDILDQQRLWQLIETAVNRGCTLPLPVKNYRELFSRTKGSVYKRLLITLRAKKGFHVDADHFQEWLHSVQAPEITVWQRDGDSVLDRAFTISLQIQSFYGQRLEAEYDTVKQLGNAPHLGFLVEALFAGLMIDAGYDFRAAWRPAAFMNVRIDYTFRDGRPPQSERRTVTAEAPNALTGRAIHELKQRTDEVLGVLSQRDKTGYVVYPPDGGLVFYNTPKGTARVFAERIVAAPTITPPSETVVRMRLRDAASWGKQQAVAALKLAEMVRDGRATANDAQELLRQFTDSVDYWNDLEQFAEDAAQYHRFAAAAP